MKAMVRAALNKLGFDLVRTKNVHDDLAKHLTNVLHSRTIDCVFDVGANSGQYGLFLRSLGYRGHIISFEPVKSVFAALKKTAASDEKWRCHNYALGERSEEKVINVYKSTVFSSFLTANDYSKDIWHSLEDVKPETVRVFRLDEVWDELTRGLGCRSYMLKLDTQGYDKHAFEGSRGRLKDVSVLQTELSLIPVYDGMAQTYDVLKVFHAAGFLISGMYPINRDKSLAVIECDCVMVKRPSS